MAANGVAKERAHYVPTFPTIEHGPAVDRAALATPAGATVLLALSRLHEKKGLDVLLKALAELPDCLAWIAGDGPLEAELKGLAAKLGVAGRARFLGWRSDRGATAVFPQWRQKRRSRLGGRLEMCPLSRSLATGAL